jgi:ferrous iron transport protein B
MASHSMAYARRRSGRGVGLVDYGKEVEQEIASLQALIEENESLAERYGSRWLAIKLLEEDSDMRDKVAATANTSAVLEQARQSVAHLGDIYGDDVDTVIADRRYGWINGLVRETVHRTTADRLTLSDRIDKIVTNRILGIPIFLAMMWIVFKVTTDVASPMLDWVDGVIGGPITNWVVAIIELLGLGGTWVESLFVDGIIAGVGGVLVFVPVLMALYLALAILEDSGYMARAAFVMDRLMHALGLHGKSFLPMIVGFGCTVPALYATRTLENEEDRILTGLLVPFMSCGARLPVYVLFAAVFFPQNTGGVVFSLYLLGIVVAIVVGMILKRTLFKGKEESPFVMELPPYRMPTLKGIWFHMWERTGAFVRKAWTIILGTSVVIWLLLAVPLGGAGAFADANVDHSLFAGVSRVIAPVFKPLGFGEWQASGSLITGFVAKEVVVGSMAQVYGAEDAAEEVAESTTFFEDVGEIATSFVGALWDTVRSIPLIVGIDVFEGEEEAEPTALMAAVEKSFQASSGGHGGLAAFGFMVFILLYTPCMVAVAAERQELGTKWMWFSIVGQLALAWLLAFLIFQGGKLLGLG